MTDRPLTDPDETEPVAPRPTLPLEADEADVLEQAVEVPLDDDEHG
jgi:hypothetical protein